MSQGLKDFYFFSHFLSQKVYAPSGQKVGKIIDLVVERAEPYPMLIGFCGPERKQGEEPFYPLGEDRFH